MASQNSSTTNTDASFVILTNENHISKSNIWFHKGLNSSLSNDPLAATNSVGGPFSLILPSRKYDGDYDGERVEWLPSGARVDPIEEQMAIDATLQGKTVRVGRFAPRMQQEFIDRHKLGELRRENPVVDANSENCDVKIPESGKI